MTIYSPNTLLTGPNHLEAGQAPGSISPVPDMVDLVESVTGMFPQTAFTTSQTLVFAQRGSLLPFTASSALTLTIPANASVAFSNGTVINVLLLAASTGTLQILGAGGVTINSNSANPATPFLRGPSSFAFLYQQATNVWYVGGDLL